MERLPRPARPLRWIGSSWKDFKEFPAKVQDQFGFSLYLAQTGQFPTSAKPLRGLDSGVIEMLDDFDGDTYRAVYVIRFKSSVYVLYSFKKKSKRGIVTPQADTELIRRRLRDAELDDAVRLKKVEKR